MTSELVNGYFSVYYTINFLIGQEFSRDNSFCMSDQNIQSMLVQLEAPTNLIELMP